MKFESIPTHVAMIYDGNRRWAEEKGLTGSEGHKAGAKNIIENIVNFGKEYGVKYMTFWLFSSENWKRETKEISVIMRLLDKAIEDFTDRFIEENVRFHHFGRKDRLPKALAKKIAKLEVETELFDEYHFCLAFDYGGRDEIIRTTQKIIKAGLKPEDLSEKTYSQYLDTKDIPDPDLIIRTSGELRLSGFFVWQGTYAELYFSQKHGPAFDREEFEKALLSYSKRQRRFGGDS